MTRLSECGSPTGGGYARDEGGKCLVIPFGAQGTHIKSNAQTFCADTAYLAEPTYRYPETAVTGQRPKGSAGEAGGMPAEGVCQTMVIYVRNRPSRVWRTCRMRVPCCEWGEPWSITTARASARCLAASCSTSTTPSTPCIAASNCGCSMHTTMNTASSQSWCSMVMVARSPPCCARPVGLQASRSCAGCNG